MLYCAPGDSPQTIKVLVEQHAANDPSDTTDRLVEVGSVNIYSDALVEGQTNPGQFHIEWNPIASDLAATTLKGTHVVI